MFRALSGWGRPYPRCQLAASDSDGDDLNYFVEPLPLPPGMRMSSLTGELEFTPSLAQVDDHELMLAASDGRFRIYQDFTVTVPPPDGPTGRARDIRREMAYDALNRLKTVTFPEPGEDITYTYDACKNGTGRICRIVDESGTLEYEYDGFGNITRTMRTELGVEYITGYEYDLEDRITAIVYPSGRRAEYDRDILGRVTEVRAEVAGQMQPILTDIQYRADGQIVAATFGNGLVEGREYDLQRRLTHQILVDGAGLIVDERNYTNDPAGNITARTGTPATSTTTTTPWIA
ncbi:MAG: hypothetical protein WD397_03800 [Wenzhouxiangellaceae bacterium]